MVAAEALSVAAGLIKFSAAVQPDAAGSAVVALYDGHPVTSFASHSADPRIPGNCYYPADQHNEDPYYPLPFDDAATADVPEHETPPGWWFPKWLFASSPPEVLVEDLAPAQRMAGTGEGTRTSTSTILAERYLQGSQFSSAVDVAQIVSAAHELAPPSVSPSASLTLATAVDKITQAAALPARQRSWPKPRHDVHGEHFAPSFAFTHSSCCPDASNLKQQSLKPVDVAQDPTQESEPMLTVICASATVDIARNAATREHGPAATVPAHEEPLIEPVSSPHLLELFALTPLFEPLPLAVSSPHLSELTAPTQWQTPSQLLASDVTQSAPLLVPQADEIRAQVAFSSVEAHGVLVPSSREPLSSEPATTSLVVSTEDAVVHGFGAPSSEQALVMQLAEGNVFDGAARACASLEFPRGERFLWRPSKN